MKALLNIARVLVGVLFIFSGLIKANDPWGLTYKMEEYFAVWQWDFINTQMALWMSVAMITFEIVAGVALLIGWKPKTFSWLLLLLIIFFTFLTGYAVFSGKIKTCGCFGDCIPLEAYQSFIKDLILLALILFIFVNRGKIKPLFNNQVSGSALLTVAAACVVLMMNVTRSLPYVDCLPYAKGKNLLQQMQPPPGSVPDSVVVMFVYKKDGKEVKFDAQHFPADFNDSTYTYVERRDEVVRKGNAEPKIQDLAFRTSNGGDTTKALLESKGRYLLLFAKDFTAPPAWQELFNKIYLKAREKNIPVYLVTNMDKAAEAWFNEKNNYKLPILTCDGTVMKTFLRSKVGYVGMNGAVVEEKRSGGDLNDAVKWMNQ